MPSSFVDNDQQINDPLEIANKFCEYFTNVGHSLAEKLSTSTIPPDFYLKKRMFESMFLKPVLVNELREIANSFKLGKACGFGEIKIDDVKPNMDSIAGPLCHIIN